MRRAIIFVALLSSFDAAFAANQHGEWSLERLNRNAVALLNRDMRLLDDRVLTAELGFTCNRQSKAFGASLIPFKGAFSNQQRDVSVLVQKSSDTVSKSDLSLEWQNGSKYMFLDDQDEIAKLIVYLKTSEHNGTDFVHFFFSGGKLDLLNHVVISLSGFSEGIAILNATCKSNGRGLHLTDSSS